MNNFTNQPGLKGFRFPRSVISYAVWVYHRFNMSTADVEDLLAERGALLHRSAHGFGNEILQSLEERTFR